VSAPRPVAFRAMIIVWLEQHRYLGCRAVSRATGNSVNAILLNGILPGFVFSRLR
jgi:hypothetical protein